ncbi:MAG: glycoside hydrolase family 99-like domain-containing protein [Candidatus Hydrogenedentes bacterium]|nr:glycoside hydrolase family 99-like domain-containing protein [Candidatus Hydrogenedentota bacterium]
MSFRIVALVAFACAVAVAENPQAQSGLRVRDFLPGKPISRAQRPASLSAAIENLGDAPVAVTATLKLPEGIALLSAPEPASFTLEPMEEYLVTWTVQAEAARQADFAVEASADGTTAARAALSVLFLSPMPQAPLAYIPEPVRAESPPLIGAHHCPLWEADKPQMWSQIRKHPERTPALGFYAQDNPEIADWETKWAVEHGIDFFIYCWYRTSQGGPVTTQFSSAIHEALFKSRYVDKMRFTIMWENQSRGRAGVADENDLMQNLLPFWMDNYFKHPSYLKVDNKPVLFIYRPEFLIDDLGGVGKVVQAFERMRQACKEQGFDGLYLLGEYRGLDPKHLTLMKSLGLDCTFAYCWYVPNNPTPEQAIASQMDQIRKTQDLGILPQVVTVSQAWSGWRDEGTIWKIPPDDYKSLLKQAGDFVATLPESELGSRMLLLDNWNEWGEGHYIAPYREFGFGYLDAVREVFSGAPAAHDDLLPEDIGFGPYDTAYAAYMAREIEERAISRQQVTKPGADEEGLIGWWAFDEELQAPWVQDSSGKRLGGMVHGAKRAPGIDGNSLLCQGGAVVVPPALRLSPTAAMSVTCWVRTDAADQDNKWIVNRVFGGGTNTGYRLGVLGGKPCFEVPQTDWSHHLSAEEALPTGRWVHLAGTFDGQMMRIFVDGEERGTMERPGPVNANTFNLCIGSYEVGHAAHFTGLVDEVKLYGRALSAAEVRAQHAVLAGKSG